VVSAPSPRRKPGPEGPSAELIAQAKDGLWSVDLFRCESILLHSHWVLVVIDVFTRRIIGFGIARASIDGISVCRMFNHAVTGQFWNAVDLARKLAAFRDYYNDHRVLAGLTPAPRAGALCPAPALLGHYGWQRHCQGPFELPIAA
jgi:transposase InsO family protein